MKIRARSLGACSVVKGGDRISLGIVDEQARNVEIDVPASDACAIEEDSMLGKVSLGKVSATPEAVGLLEEIIADHGPVLFHQSGGCCDGSSPMCYPRGDFIVGDRDVLLGHIGDTPVYISQSQYEAWKHTDLIIDVVPGRGGMFSLDNGRERRFLTRSTVCAAPFSA